MGRPSREETERRNAEKAAQQVSITETPEFKAAVEAAVQSAVQKIAAHGAPVGTGTDPQATQLFSQMALAIAEISDQGTDRKRVAPEILAQRAQAHKRAVQLLEFAAKEGLKPEYRVVSKIYFNERFVEPFRRLADKSVVPNEITWTGMPNDALRPINDIAKQIYTAYRESIGAPVDLQTRDNRPVYVTAAGMVVKGDAPKRSTLGNGTGTDVPQFGDDLGVKSDPRDPTAPFVNVLGTVAPAARQNYAGIDQSKMG